MRLLGEVGDRDHQDPEGEQYSESEWCSDQHASVHFVPSPLLRAPRAPVGSMRFESVTMTAGEMRDEARNAGSDANRDLG